LWLQHRRRLAGLGLWVAGFSLQTVSVLLLALRGVVPDILSMIAGNSLSIAGTIILFIGLEHYLGRRRPQTCNWLLLAVFTAIQTYFTVAHPDLAIRIINVSTALLLISIQIAWLMLHRAEPRLRPATRSVGAVFCAYALVSVVRIIGVLVAPMGSDYLTAGLFEALVLLAYQMLFIALTLSLFLMVSRRLSGALEEDIAQRERAQEDLKRSDEKFSLAFQNIPDAIALTSIKDGTIIDINETFSRVTGYSRDEVIGRTTTDLNLWVNAADRARFVDLLTGHGQVRNYETEFRMKSGEVRTGWMSGNLVQDGQNTHMLSVIHDVTERKRMEMTLQEARVTAEKYLNIAAEVIIGLDAQGTITLLNDSGHRLLGYEPGELIGKSWFDTCLPEEAKANVRGVFLKLMGGEYAEVLTYENAVITAKGDKRVLLWHNTLLRDPDGRIAGTLSSAEDITERRRAEEALATSEQLLHAVQEISLIGGWQYDVQMHRIEWTDEVYRIHELPDSYDPNDITSNIQFYAPDDRARIQEAFNRAITTGEPYDLELQFVTAKGSHRWVRTVGRPELKDGNVVRVVGNIADITERKQVVERLRQSEADLSQAQAVAHVGSWRWDIAHDNLVWSDEMYRIFGIAPHEFTGSLQDVIARAIHPEDRARVDEVNRSVVEENRPQPLEYRIVWPDGSIRTVWAEAGGMTLDSSGNISSLTGAVLDITDRKRAEAEKEAMQAQLMQAQKMEAVGQLAGGVAHDFNNLLTGILGNVAIARSDLPPSAPMVANLDAAETAARQAADLARGLLTFSRKAVVSAKPLNIAEAIAATLNILQQSLPATMNIVRDVEQSAWNVLADESQMAQVIINLALNARDAMKGRGTLSIRLRNVEIGEDYVRAHSFARTGDFVHLSITDTGPGIPDEIRRHLFEPFFTTKPAGSGTGLGLSIVYGAVKQAGGWITADSPPDAGAVFDIFLPRCLDLPGERVALDRSAVTVRSGTVLVVEDEPVVSTVAKALLERCGYLVVVAGDGASALARMHQHAGTIDLVLLDMTMPGMTTDDIVRAMHDIDAHVPILLTSGYTSGDTVTCMLGSGAVQGFLAKPYDLHELMDSVQKLMDKE
jgi:two-component system cell cycle sensor histidine kinase/response regulator CckA